MAVRIKFGDGSEIETDSAAEAVEVYRELAGLAPAIESEDDSEEIAPRKVELGNKAKTMLRTLMALEPEAGESTVDLAKKLGLGDPKGLAAITRQIRAWARWSFGLDGSQCVSRFRDSKTGQSCILLEPELRGRIKGHEKVLLG